MAPPKAPESPGPPIQLPWPRRASKYESTMSKFHKAFKMNTQQAATLKQLYSTKASAAEARHARRSGVQTVFLSNVLQAHMPEMAFALWGFVKDRAERNELLKMLYDTLNPRVAFAADTRQSFFECILVLDPQSIPYLHVPSHQIKEIKPVTAVEVERWLETFLDCCNISGGLCQFERYMDDTMVSCIDRIETGSCKDGCFGTIFDTNNRDFYRLYALRKSVIHSRADAQLHTGMELSVSSLVQLYTQHAILQRQLTDQIERERTIMTSGRRDRERMRSARRGALEVAQILMSMNRTGSVSIEMRDHMLDLLGLAATTISTANLQVFPSMNNVTAVFPYNDSVTLLRTTSPPNTPNTPNTPQAPPPQDAENTQNSPDHMRMIRELQRMDTTVRRGVERPHSHFPAAPILDHMTLQPHREELNPEPWRREFTDSF